METKLNIYEKLQLCRVKLQQMKLKKGGKNKYAGFEYYELADFIPAVNQLFLDHKLHSVFNIEEAVNETTGAISGKATLKIINIDNPDEYEIFSSPTADANLKGCTPIQSLGGVHTYLKRYLYLNALEIVEPDLLDNVTGSDEEKKPTKPQNKVQNKPISETLQQQPIINATPEQVAILERQDDKVKDWACKKYGVAALNQLTAEQADIIIRQMEAKGALK